MLALRDETMQSFRVSPAFSIAVLLSLGTAGLIGVMVVMMQLQPGFMGMTHFADPLHRVHDLAFGSLFGVTGVGLLAQFRSPSKNVASMAMALIPWVGLLVAGLSSDVFRVMVINPSRSVAAVTVLTTLLHPAGREFFSSFSVSRVNPVMFALVVIAAVPLLGFALTNLGLQRTDADVHAAMGHYGFMAALGFTIIGCGLLAGLRPDGWRFAAWVAGLLMAIFGLISIILPDNSSALGPVGAVAAILWGVGFVVAAERSRMAESMRDDARVEADGGQATRPAHWMSVLRIIAVVLVLLVFITTLTTLTGVRLPVGPGGHTPPGQH